ncbi:MAG: hypothetical protein HYX55_00620 [Chloroflexi bacterium]|nr:hypothetical protein [Chloroflexota bacterium]
MDLKKLPKSAATPTKAEVPAVKPADRRRSLSRRGPVWRRGTLVLVA